MAFLVSSGRIVDLLQRQHFQSVVSAAVVAVVAVVLAWTVAWQEQLEFAVVVVEGQEVEQVEPLDLHLDLYFASSCPSMLPSQVCYLLEIVVQVDLVALEDRDVVVARVDLVVALVDHDVVVVQVDLVDLEDLDVVVALVDLDVVAVLVDLDAVVVPVGLVDVVVDLGIVVGLVFHLVDLAMIDLGLALGLVQVVDSFFLFYKKINKISRIRNYFEKKLLRNYGEIHRPPFFLCKLFQ